MKDEKEEKLVQETNVSWSMSELVPKRCEKQEVMNFPIGTPRWTPV